MKHDRDLGSCVVGCGRPAVMPKHRCCRTCYPTLRVWSNVKTPEQRRDYKNTLTVRMSRLALIDQKLIVIGTSPYTWKEESKSNVVRLNLVARQRGSVR